MQGQHVASRILLRTHLLSFALRLGFPNQICVFRTPNLRKIYRVCELAQKRLLLPAHIVFS